MIKTVILLLLIMSLPIYAGAQEIEVPSVPDSVEDLLPNDQESFADGLWYIISKAIETLQPELYQCLKVCISVLSVGVLLIITQSLQGSTTIVHRVIGTTVIAGLLFEPTNTLMQCAAETVQQLSDYGKLLLPVMTTALASQGGVTSSASIYVATAFIDAVLSTAISSLLIPAVYIYLVISVINQVAGDGMLKQLCDFIKWLLHALLRWTLYIFTGYLTITGVITGTTDQTAVKAAKLTLSGMVPFVGGLLADASETVLVGASAVKNTVGIGGLLALIGICAVPFLSIGIQYLCLKATSGLYGIISDKDTSALVHDFSGAMGLLLAMTGSVCLIQVISTVCFMKGMG